MLFFRKKNPEISDNPYLNAKRSWNAHEGAILSSRLMWQIVGVLSLLIALSAVGGIVYIGQQSKFIPYVVQVDKLGQSLAVARADRAAPADSKVIHASLAAFIVDARKVTPDVNVQRDAIFKVYAMLNPSDAATVKMNEFLNGNEDSNPFKRAAKETVHVEITSVLPQSAETWQVDWLEEVRDRQGALRGKHRMRAILNIAVFAPDNKTEEAQIRRNPLGLFVQDFNWSKQL